MYLHFLSLLLSYCFIIIIVSVRNVSTGRILFQSFAFSQIYVCFSGVKAVITDGHRILSTVLPFTISATQSLDLDYYNTNTTMPSNTLDIIWSCIELAPNFGTICPAKFILTTFENRIPAGIVMFGSKRLRVGLQIKNAYGYIGRYKTYSYMN